MFLISFLLGNFAITCGKPTFFGLVPWYQYLTVKPQTINGSTYCNVQFNVLGGGSASSILLVLLAVLDDLIRIAAMAAAGFVIWGGLKYITSQGSPDATKQAQQTIINAMIGLVLAIMAAALVSFLGNSLVG